VQSLPQPFYTVAYGVRAGGRAQVVRHTPTWDRAHTLLTWFLRDVTDPVVLGTRHLCRRRGAVAAGSSTVSGPTMAGGSCHASER
jgi:hypothetical protein